MVSPVPRHSPLSEHNGLDKAPAKKLREQLRFELDLVKTKTGMTEEELAHHLGFQGGASVSKWLTGRDPVSRKAALALDRSGHTTSIGKTFEEIQKAYRAATGTTPAKSQIRSPETYDVFLASPMASLSGPKAYETERQAARDLKEVFENFFDYSVYYAGEALESEEEFDPSLVAAEQNFDALRNSRYFVLLSVSKATKPSSVTVEAGYALGCGVPSLYLVSNAEHLPFLLRALGSHKSPDLPPVHVEMMVNSSKKAVGLMRKHGTGILSRLDERAVPSKPRRIARQKKKTRSSR